MRMRCYLPGWLSVFAGTLLGAAPGAAFAQGDQFAQGDDLPVVVEALALEGFPSPSDLPTHVEPPRTPLAADAAAIGGEPGSPSDLIPTTPAGDLKFTSHAWAEHLGGACGEGCPTSACEAAEKAKKKQEELEKAAGSAYKNLFFNNDFRYLADPAYNDWHLGENLKRIAIGQHVCVDLGGQYRARLMNERGIRGLGLTGRNDDFLLHRTRLYANVQATDYFRFYGEMLDADSNYEVFRPRLIEENRYEIHNLFGDARLLKNDQGELWARVGRQELAFGAQRLVSPLDWANTRRTFEGYNVFWRGQDWDVDAFYTRPVNVHVDRLDSPDQRREFMGVYSAYKGVKNHTYDLYYLNLTNQLDPSAFHTFGGRAQGSHNDFLWDTELMYQTGEFRGAGHSAWAFTVGFGRKMVEIPCFTPTLWFYCDWAQGDEVQGNAFHDLFPLAHKYLGFMDLYARRNIIDYNVLMTMPITSKISFLAWYHVFSLENIRDTPYNVNETPFNPANAPGDRELGQEIDFLVTWAISARMELQLGYSHFFAGDYYSTTAGTTRRDADFVYTQFQVNF